MTAISLTPTRILPDGRHEVRAVIISDSTPASLPTSGDGVAGMSANDVFAPFSVLFVTADVEPKVYITNERGMFIPQ